MFEDLHARPIDPLLDIIRQFREDTRANKIDLGVGVFQDESGRTPILNTVKKAEAHLLETQETKTYLGADGDREFAESVAELVLGDLANRSNRITLQAPGGTGALRLGAELIRHARPDAQIWLGRPTWPNHEPIFKASGLAIRDHRHFDIATQSLCFDELVSAMESAKRGDVFVLHASCHNPTGADFSADQWQEIANLCANLGIVPFLDFAYQGLGNGLDEDAAGARALIAQVPEALMATSCSKNFGLYRERTGALFVFAPGARIDAIRSNLFGIARANYSMPPDHGAAIVRTILHDAGLRAEWQREVSEMQRQLRATRINLANLRINSLDLSALAHQNGMFATLPLTPAQIARLKQEHAIYMVPSGRLNIAGLVAANLDAFGSSLQAVMTDAAA